MVLVHFSSKKKEKRARKNLSKLSQIEKKTKQMSRQVTTVKQVSFDSLFLNLYIYKFIYIMQTSVFFSSCLYVKTYVMT